MRLLAISGSLREGSYNTALARAAAELAPAGIEIDLYDGLASLPPYDGDTDAAGAPEPVQELRRAIEAADGLLVVTPEYNGSIPGVLKNAIDWASRPHREAALWGKTVAVAGASPGAYGALWAQTDLRRVLGVAGARVIEGELAVARANEAFDEDGLLVDATLAERLAAHVERLVTEAAPALIAA